MSLVPVLVASATTFDFAAITQIADTIVSLVGKVVTMVTSSPLLLLGLGIGLFSGAIGIVRRFI